MVEIRVAYYEDFTKAGLHEQINEWCSKYVVVDIYEGFSEHRCKHYAYVKYLVSV